MRDPCCFLDRFEQKSSQNTCGAKSRPLWKLLWFRIMNRFAENENILNSKAQRRLTATTTSDHLVIFNTKYFFKTVGLCRIWLASFTSCFFWGMAIYFPDQSKVSRWERLNFKSNVAEIGYNLIWATVRSGRKHFKHPLFHLFTK